VILADGRRLGNEPAVDQAGSHGNRLRVRSGDGSTARDELTSGPGCYEGKVVEVGPAPGGSVAR
jgi:hypothetical protein